MAKFFLPIFDSQLRDTFNLEKTTALCTDSPTGQILNISIAFLYLQLLNKNVLI
jgi:hypothetical protein